MPMKWTTENDHLLLLKILECSPGLTIDGKKIAAAWPTDRGEVPTPRAITEHVISIRKKLGAIGGGTGANSQNDDIGKKASPRKHTPKEPLSTPKKRAPRMPKTPVKYEEEDSEVIQDVKEDMNDEDDDVYESPTKRQKVSDDDEENYGGSSGSVSR